MVLVWVMVVGEAGAEPEEIDEDEEELADEREPVLSGEPGEPGEASIVTKSPPSFLPHAKVGRRLL